MADTFWTTGGRTDSFRYVRVSWPGFEEMEDIGCISECTIDESAFTTLKTSGEISYTSKEPIALGDDLIRIYSISTLGNETRTVCHGTLFAQSDDYTDRISYRQGKMELYSILKVLKDEQTTETMTVPAGTKVTDRVAEIVGARHLRCVTTESDSRTQKDMTWDFGTDIVRICNELLATIGYRSLYPDAYGNVCISPQTELTASVPSVIMSDTDPTVSITESEYEGDLDMMEIPNRVAVISEDDNGKGFRGVAENLDPNNPWSIPSRKKVITRCEKLERISSDEAAKAKAEEYLKNGMFKVETLTIKHFYMPFEILDSAQFDFINAGKTGKYSISKRKRRMEPGIPCTTSMRRFVDLSAAGR